jgi:N-acyl-D-aspartate/D-glutamate deacylase
MNKTVNVGRRIRSLRCRRADRRCLAGHGTLRLPAMGMERRAATPKERAVTRASLEEAIEAGAFGLSTGLIMTGLPARIFNIPDRGTIAPGMFADLVAFNPQTFSDDLDYRDPVRNPKGLAWVMQRGTQVVRGTTYLGRRCGARLRRVTPAVADPHR